MPVSAMQETLRLIADSLRPGVVVTDVGSTKRQVMAWAAELLPSHVNFVGGHPMAGKETAGIEAADATLFEKRPYCITPSVNASTEAVDSVVALVNALGAEPYFLDPEEHDGLVAATAAHHRTLLFTLDERAELTYSRLGVAFQRLS
jgi:prephenate dehydrogenase